MYSGGYFDIIKYLQKRENKNNHFHANDVPNI